MINHTYIFNYKTQYRPLHKYYLIKFSLENRLKKVPLYISLGLPSRQIKIRFCCLNTLFRKFCHLYREMKLQNHFWEYDLYSLIRVNFNMRIILM